MRRRTFAALLLTLALAGKLDAQQDPLGTRLINVATPFPAEARTLEVLFVHRFHLPVNEGSAHDLWGLDSGADVGIGLTWGLTSRLDAILLRSSFQEDFELAGKLLVFEPSARAPFALSVRAGVDRLVREGVEDPTRPFAQILLARRFASGFSLLLSPSWVRDTPRLRNAFNVPVGLAIELPRDNLIEIEVVPENRDLDESKTAWHAAFSKHVGGHIFEIVVGNSRAFTVDQILGGDSAAGFETGDARLGFNLIRELDL